MEQKLKVGILGATGMVVRDYLSGLRIIRGLKL